MDQLGIARAPQADTKGLWHDVETALLKHHHEPDLQAARAAYAAIAAHSLGGQPVWPMLVAPPGSMKTDLIAALDGLPRVHLIDRVTPNTFLSGQIKDKSRTTNTTSSSLLHRIGPDGIIAYPDFSTVLSMNRDNRGSVLADMRRIYDGHLRREFGTDDPREQHEWKGRITFAVAATDEVDRHYSVFQTLGERFVMIRWHRPGGTEAALRAMNQDISAGKRDLRQAVQGLFTGLQPLNPVLPGRMQNQIAALAEFAVRARTHISRDGRTKDIIYTPEAEAPTRLAQQLAQLTKGSALLDGRSASDVSDYALTQRVAFDCIPATRRKIFSALLKGKSVNDSGLPTSTSSYAIEELDLLELATTQGWSPLARRLLTEAGIL